MPAILKSNVRVILASILLVPCLTISDPIQWEFTDGGNGHYYEKVLISLPWEEANDYASNQTWLGLSGYLASISTEGENLWLFNTLSGLDCWLGGYQPEGSDEPSGDWRWSNGEPWFYSNWGPGEPNDSGNEDYLQFSSAARWNDIGSSSLYFLVEYGDSEIDIEFTLQIDVEKADGGYPRDFGTIAGIGLGASDGYDPEFDQPEVPHGPSNYVSCYFSHPEWDSPFGEEFNSDYRESIDPLTEFVAWDFSVETDHTETDFEVSFNATPPLPYDFQVILLELDGDLQWDLNLSSSIQVYSRDGTRHFRLVFGNDYESSSVTSWSSLKLQF
jgi:hypothetical protein